MRTTALFTCLFALQAGAIFAETIVRDHVTNSSLWDGTEVMHAWDEVGLNEADAIGATSFLGNGRTLTSISGIFGKSGSGGENNGGDWTRFDFRFIFYKNAAAFTSDPRNGTLVSVFDTPSNPDYLDIVGTSQEGFDLFRFEFDISGLGIQTMLGETHLLAIAPTSAQLDGISKLAFSTGPGIGTSPDWLFNDLVDLGPDTLNNLGAPQSFAAYRVTTASVLVPEPGTLTLALLGVIFLALRSRAL